VDIASLGLAVDSRGVKTGVSDLDQLTSASAKAEKAAEGLAATSKRTSKEIADAHVQAKAAVDAANRASAQAAASLKSGIVPDDFKKIIPQANSAATAVTNIGMSAKQTQAAMRMLPAQFTDIATQLAGGQSPFLILLQQGGQIKDSFGGIGPAVKQLTTLITPMRLAVTGAAGAAGALALAYHEGSKEADEYNKAIILTGNASGTTAGQMDAMAKNISKVAGTQGEAAEALVQMAASGRVAGSNLEQFSALAVRMDRTVGQSVGDTVKMFAELGKAPAAASVKLTQTYNYLTAAVYAKIKALEEAGRKDEAAALAQKTLADALNGRMKSIEEGAGSLERAWRKVKDEVKGALDAMLEIGRKETTQRQIDSIDAQIKSLDERKSTSPSRTASRRSALADRKEELQELQRLEARSAGISAENVKKQNAGIAATDFLKKLDDQKRGVDRVTSALQDYQVQLKAYNSANPDNPRSAKQVAADESFIRKQFANKDDDGIAKARLNADLARIKRDGESLTTAYANAESILDANRSARLVSDREYYDAKLAFIRLNEQAQIKVLEDDNARLAKQKGSAKDVIDNQVKIADNETKIAIIKAKSASESTKLGIEQKSASDLIVRGYKEAEAAAQSYLDTLRRANQRELDGMGKGEDFRRYQGGRSQIDDRYEQQKLQLESDKRRGAFNGREDEYQTELARIKRFQEAALADWDVYYASRRQKEADWSVGASEAMANYVAEARNAAKQAEGLFTNAFQGMEDALVQFVMTGKLSFSDLAKSIIADMIRIQVRQSASGLFATLGKAALNYFTSDAGVGPVPYANYNAKGNAFEKGRVSRFAAGAAFTNRIVDKPTRFNIGEMGEAGPEAIMPLRRGPDGSLGVMAAGGSGGGQVNFNVEINNNNNSRVTTRPKDDGRGILVMIDAMDNALADRIGSGTGATNAAIQGRYGLRPQV
jgi:lambda family phage tail tape measure protein